MNHYELDTTAQHNRDRDRDRTKLKGVHMDTKTGSFSRFSFLFLIRSSLHQFASELAVLVLLEIDGKVHRTINSFLSWMSLSFSSS